MIDLNKQRKNPTDTVQVVRGLLTSLNLSTVEAGDWLEGIGTIREFAVIGFLKQCHRAGLQFDFQRSLGFVTHSVGQVMPMMLPPLHDPYLCHECQHMVHEDEHGSCPHNRKPLPNHA